MILMRTIVEETEVSKKIDHVSSQFSRIGEMFAGLKWRLAREPECGYRLPTESPAKYLYKIDPLIKDLPVMTVLYTYNDSMVNILDIKLSPRNIGVEDD